MANWLNWLVGRYIYMFSNNFYFVADISHSSRGRRYCSI